MKEAEESREKALAAHQAAKAAAEEKAKTEPACPPPPCDPKDLQKIDDNWLKKHGIDAHDVKDGYPQGDDLFYHKKTGKVYFSPKGVKPNCDEALGTLADLAKQHLKDEPRIWKYLGNWTSTAIRQTSSVRGHLVYAQR
jgi:hypothetical protein